MRRTRSYKMLFETFEELMEFVNNNKDKIENYSGVKYKEDYILTFEPTPETERYGNIKGHKDYGSHIPEEEGEID